MFMFNNDKIRLSPNKWISYNSILYINLFRIQSHDKKQLDKLNYFYIKMDVRTMTSQQSDWIMTNQMDHRRNDYWRL